MREYFLKEIFFEKISVLVLTFDRIYSIIYSVASDGDKSGA